MKSYINKKNIIIILVLFIVTVLIFVIGLKDKKNMPLAKKGVLDITDWNLQKDGPIKLDGEWEFYWNKLLTYDDFHTGNKKYKPSGYFNVPNAWNNYEINDKKLSAKGYATYRLKIKTKNINDLKGIKLLTQSTAYKLMINREIVAENGIVGQSKETYMPEYKPQIAHFNNNFTEFEIIMQISNFTYARGGFWHSIDLGTFEEISTMKENSTRREMILFGAVLQI